MSPILTEIIADTPEYTDVARLVVARLEDTTGT